MSTYQNLVNFVNELISYKATHTADGYILSLCELDESELGELATLFLEYDERDTTDCFQNPNQTALDDDITIALMKMLKSNSLDDKEDFAELVRKNTINRYAKHMQEMIDEQCAQVESDTMEESGYVRRQHRDNGESYWVHL